MTDTKHTPGPWHIAADRLDGRCQVPINAVADNEAIAGVDARESVYSGYGVRVDKAFRMETGQRRTWANARLIAAAPDLLEALQRVAHVPCEQPAGAHCTMLSEHTGKTCPWCQIRATIAKATGQES